MTEDIKNANDETRDAWNENAEFWDERMGAEGNDFVNVLVWPATEELLELKPGEHVLDIACGNGLSSRRLAASGAQVVAFDFAENMIVKARLRTTAYTDRIQYQVLDATDEKALLRLGEGQFDAAICNMALFDMAEIKPLLNALVKLLHPGGRFVFSVVHPCFNGSQMNHVAELEEVLNKVFTTYSIRVSRYLTPVTEHGMAIIGQPKLQIYFHRPLHLLLGTCFAAGFLLDGLREPSFPHNHPAGRNPLSWGGNFHEIPPVLVARMRLPGAPG